MKRKFTLESEGFESNHEEEVFLTSSPPVLHFSENEAEQPKETKIMTLFYYLSPRYLD